MERTGALEPRVSVLDEEFDEAALAAEEEEAAQKAQAAAAQVGGKSPEREREKERDRGERDRCVGWAVLPLSGSLLRCCFCVQLPAASCNHVSGGLGRHLSAGCAGVGWDVCCRSEQ
jgi:hypothetical protein